MATLKLNICGEQAMEAAGCRLVSYLPAHGFVLFLHGNLGAGKTTFSRGLLRGLGHTGSVKSPTYTLVEEYDLPARPVYHFDLYRLGDPEEIEYLGIRDFFQGNSLCLLEWAERGKGYLPTADLELRISYENPDCRQLQLTGLSNSGNEVLVRLGDGAGLISA